MDGVGASPVRPRSPAAWIPGGATSRVADAAQRGPGHAAAVIPEAGATRQPRPRTPCGATNVSPTASHEGRIEDCTPGAGPVKARGASWPPGGFNRGCRPRPRLVGVVEWASRALSVLVPAAGRTSVKRGLSGQVGQVRPPRFPARSLENPRRVSCTRSSPMRRGFPPHPSP